MITPAASQAHSHASRLQHTLVITKFQKPQYKVPLAPTRPADNLLLLPALPRTRGSLNRWLGLLSHPCTQRNILFPPPRIPPQHQLGAHTPRLPRPQSPQATAPSTGHRQGGGLGKSSTAAFVVATGPGSSPPPGHCQVRQSSVPCFGQHHIQVEASNGQCLALWPVPLDLCYSGSTRTQMMPKPGQTHFWKETWPGGDEARLQTREELFRGPSASSGSHSGQCPPREH